MYINVKDIPKDGKNFEISLDAKLLNERTNKVRNPGREKAILPPEYIFTKDPDAEIFISLKGTTVMIEGKLHASFITPCSRCAEDLESKISNKIEMVLKPLHEKEQDKAEDLGFGFYNGKEFDISEILEEQLMLSLPYAVSCSANKIKDCEKAVQSLEYAKRKEVEDSSDNPFSVLKGLKLN